MEHSMISVSTMMERIFETIILLHQKYFRKVRKPLVKGRDEEYDKKWDEIKDNVFNEETINRNTGEPFTYAEYVEYQAELYLMQEGYMRELSDKIEKTQFLSTAADSELMETLQTVAYKVNAANSLAVDDHAEAYNKLQMEIMQRLERAQVEVNKSKDADYQAPEQEDLGNNFFEILTKAPADFSDKH